MNKPIDKWFKKVVAPEKFKAGVPTFTALEVLKLLNSFYHSIKTRTDYENL